MENHQENRSNNIKVSAFLCILCAASLGVIGIFHLFAYNRAGDYYCAAASVGMIWPLINIYRNLK